MRIQLLVVAGLLGSCAASAPIYHGSGVASELVGHVAGPPQRCVSIQRDWPLRPASGDPGTLVYGFGDKVWANHLSPGCGFTAGQMLVMNPLGSEYCRGDVVRSVESGGFPGATCILNDWVPYTKLR